MASVELAAALPVLVLVVLVGVSAVRVADVRARCLDGAREAARAAARGDSRAVSLARQAAGADARVSVGRSGDEVTATVRLDVHPFGGALGTVTVSERAVAASEPDDTADDP